MREIDIRQALLHTARVEHAGDPDTLMVEELGLCAGTARVDFAVVNGSVHGFEIKSAQDTLTRLPTQSEIYNRALDRVTLVVDRKHLVDARSLIPGWWGILEPRRTRDGLVAFRTVRKAADNPHVEAFAQAQLLWREEALAELEARSMAHGLRSKPRRVIWERLVQVLTREELGEAVRSRLKNRATWRVESQSA
jgi:hypothetical protein